MALIGYARVSTNDQHPESQLDQLHAAGCEKVFVDHGVSGKLARRAQFDACLEYLRPGDTLVVTKLDRAGRSVKHLIAVAEQLKTRGIGLKVLLQGIDTTTSAGRLFFNIMASIAEFEGDIISERTVDGLAAARARGRKGGRKPVLTPRQVAQIRKMHQAGDPITDIAATFRVSRPTIYKAVEPA